MKEKKKVKSMKEINTRITETLHFLQTLIFRAESKRRNGNKISKLFLPIYHFAKRIHMDLNWCFARILTAKLLKFSDQIMKKITTKILARLIHLRVNDTSKK